MLLNVVKREWILEIDENMKKLSGYNYTKIITSVLFVLFLLGCSPADQNSTTSNMVVSDDMDMPENSEVFENPTGESFEITTTHWLNERPIGDGDCLLYTSPSPRD